MAYAETVAVASATTAVNPDDASIERLPLMLPIILPVTFWAVYHNH